MPTNSNIFMKGGAPAPPGGSGGPGYSIRSNAQASVGFAGGGPSSPILATNAGNGRPTPTLNYVKVTLEGDAGSLRRGEFQVTCFNPSDFESVISQGGVGAIGAEITISMSRSGPGAGGATGKTFRVYKNTFAQSKEGKYTVTVHAVGKGSEILKKDGISMGPVGKGKFFYKNPDSLWWPFPEKVEVSGLMDYFLQYITEKTAKVWPFSPEVNACEQGKFFTLVAPTGYTPPPNAPGFGGGVGLRNRLAYINFGWLIKTINDNIAPNNLINIATVNSVVDDKGTPLMSGDPTRVMIPRADGFSDYSEAPVALSELIFSLLGTPSKLGTSFLDPVPSPLTGDQADVGLIYISYDALRAIETDLTGKGEGGKAADEEAKFDNKGSKMTLEGFLSGVFGVVREATGGALDLVTTEDPDAWTAGTLDSDIYIVNKKCKQEPAGPVPYDDVSGEGGVRSATISGDVPKGWQQVAFGGGQVGSADDPEKKTPAPKDIINDAKSALGKDGYDAAPLAAIKSALRQAQDEIPTPSAGPIQNRAYPIGLALKLNGTPGIEFGHVVDLASLSSTRWADNTLFTVVRVIHTVQGQDWTTDVETVARLKP